MIPKNNPIKKFGLPQRQAELFYAHYGKMVSTFPGVFAKNYAQIGINRLLINLIDFLMDTHKGIERMDARMVVVDRIGLSKVFLGFRSFAHTEMPESQHV